MKISPLALLSLLFTAYCCWAQTDGGVPRLYVDNKPYPMLTGELHNSSASSVEYMKPIWDKLSALP